jgi:DNA helicase-2/ATP-dependent DNA helicase PcrA
MNSDIFSDLNEQQLTAVQQPAGAVLILAGPGSGKTRLLVSRIVWLIRQQGIEPEKILAVTFTNKAAAEMKSRLQQLIGQSAEPVTVSTFHSFMLRLLRKYHHYLDLSRYFSIASPEYLRHLLRNLCAPYIRENIEAKVSGMLLAFSNYIMKGKELPSFSRERYAEYINHLKKHHLIDFDQILVLARKLLSDYADILQEYQFLYPAILVDEFQDTDPVQYDVLYLLAGEHKNIFVVADDDQSIYSWRGADPENIRRFIADFKVNPILMEINYRNGQNILDCASRIISNTERIEPGKFLKVDTGRTDQVEVKFFLTDSEEIDYILQKIRSWQQQGLDYKQIALIYPFHRIGQIVEDYLLKNQIPYQLAEGRSFLDHPYLNKILLYLSLIRDIQDQVALEELTRAELGQSLYNFIKDQAIRRKISFRKTLSQLYQGEEKSIGLETKFKLRRLVTHIANLFNLKYFFTLSKLIDQINSLPEQQQNSFLARYNIHLESVARVADILGNLDLPAGQYHWCVYHPDKRISFLASELIALALQQPVSVFPVHQQNTAALPLHMVLLEFAPSQYQDEYYRVIPLYKLKNEKRTGSLAVLFKYLQWYTTQYDQTLLNRYVVLDLETTSKDAYSCAVVEFAAVLVEDGEIIKEMNVLINPRQPITAGALAVHHITEQMVRDQPDLQQYWPEIKAFLGDEVMVAHNGFGFDFIILDRMAKQFDGHKLNNRRIDTLAIARNLYPDLSNSVDSLMERLEIRNSLRHRALSDVHILAEIFQKMQQEQLTLSKKLSLESFLDYVALGNFLEHTTEKNEDRIFFINGARKLGTHYSQILHTFCVKYGLDEIQMASDIHNKLSELNPFAGNLNRQEQLLSKIKLMAQQFDHLPVDEAIAQFLSALSLNSAQDELEDVNAVSLLTYHAAKGLEFEKVIIMGLENNNMPGYHALREEEDDERPLLKKIEEQRRLLYVGITRARNELILTVVKNRGGWQQEYSSFIKELQLPYAST